MDASSPLPPRDLLAQYSPALDSLRWVRVEAGFSGALVWRGDDESGRSLFALKAWPTEMQPARLSRIHAWMRQAATTPYVPQVLPTVNGTWFATLNDRVWDAVRWLPGTPRDTPSIAEVECACAAVAQLHQRWPASGLAACPAVQARLRVLGAPLPTFAAQQLAALPGELAELLRRGSQAVASAGPPALESLRRWESIPFPLQPCIRDLRGEHILFAGSMVTGIVDFGAMAEDDVAVDLARLLGDFAGEDENLFSAGLRAYRDARGIPVAPEEFVRELDRAGIVCSVVGWLQRLLIERKTHFNLAAVTIRLRKLVSRVERFRPV